MERGGRGNAISEENVKKIQKITVDRVDMNVYIYIYVLNT
jgi:hypothetical protein